LALESRKKGGMREMKEKGRTKEEGQTTEGGGGLDFRLPELSEDQRKHAQDPKMKSWAIETVSLGAGYIWDAPDTGIALQVYNDSTIRLLTVVDHEYFIESVSYLRATLDSVGIHLDMSRVVMRERMPSVDDFLQAGLTAAGSDVEVV
jgi:hypothetical protein